MSFLSPIKMTSKWRISKSWKIPHNLVIEALPRQGLITGYTMHYDPQVKDHGIIIDCLIFHGLLMPCGKAWAASSVCRGTLTSRTCAMFPALPLEIWEMIFDLLPGRVLQKSKPKRRSNPDHGNPSALLNAPANHP